MAWIGVSPGGSSNYIQNSYIIIMKLYLCLFQNKGVDFHIRAVAILRVYVNTVHRQTLCCFFVKSSYCRCHVVWPRKHIQPICFRACNECYISERKEKEKTIKRQN